MASGTIKAVASKADIANKADSIYLTSSDTTWSNVWAKISTLKTGYAAPIFSTADASKALTNNVRSNTLVGIIVKASSARYYLLYQHSTASNEFAVATLDANSAGVTSYSENPITSKLPNFKTIPVSNDDELTITNNSRIGINICSSSPSRCGELSIYTTSTGTVRFNQSGAASLTITTDSEKPNWMKISGVSTSTTILCATIFGGDISKANS